MTKPKVTIHANVERFQRAMRGAAYALDPVGSTRYERLRRVVSWVVLIGAVLLAALLLIGGVIVAHS